jgi:TonB family protein
MAVKRAGTVMKTLFWMGLSLFWVAGPIRSQPQEKPAPAQTPSALMESLSRAYQLLSENKPKEARVELERAQTLASGPCGECLLGMAYVYSAEKDWNRTKATLQEAIPLLKPPVLAARAYNLLGTTAVQAKGDHSDQEAEDAFRHSATLGGTWGMKGQYNLARLFLAKERWAEAVQASRTYLAAAGPKDAAVDQARIVLCLARGNLPEDSQASPESATDLVRTNVGTTPPVILFKIKPTYTKEARQAKDQGKVSVESIIDREGCVTHAHSLQGLPHGLTEAAVNAVRKWTFKPATKDGVPVRVYYVLNVSFAVQAGPPVPALPGTVP